MQKLRFNQAEGRQFYATLRQRVDSYFKENELSRKGDYRMWIKTIFMFSIYLIPYALMITGTVTGGWLVLLCIVMGFGVGGLGLAVMHDANHGAYSKNPRVNKIMSLTMNFIGGSAHNWKIQHNVLHHSYTNVDGHDEDISPGVVLRFSPHEKLRKAHRFQAVYAWFFYGLSTFWWVIGKDFQKIFEYNTRGFTKVLKASFRREFIILTLGKLFYAFYLLVVPLLLMDITFGQWALGFFIVHFVAGLTMTLIFQPAHVMLDSEYPLPSEDGKLENSWAVHQLSTTTNFAVRSKWFTWAVGGLNHQIEHHLFPNVCHIHYSKISEIVKETAEEFGLPYYTQPTFFRALVEHGKMLHKLGQAQAA